MSSSLNWLPPLRFSDGRQAHTTVEISQTELHGYDKFLRKPTTTVSFEASVYFVSENTDPSTRQTEFCGLQIEDCFNEANLHGIIKEVSRNFPFFGERIAWSENHYDEVSSESSEFSSACDVFQGIEKFLREAKEKEYNQDTNVISIELKIHQEIVISDQELRSWNSWYAAMSESYPTFEEEWYDKITRARSEEELMNVARVPQERYEKAGIFQVVETAQSCPICLDEVAIGSKAIKLSCGHIFGIDCVKKWLQKSNTCPMCRACMLRSAFEHLL